MDEYIVDSAILETSLHQFIPPHLVASFTTALLNCQGVIAGSWALHIVQSAQHSSLSTVKSPYQPTWQPRDMDIWIAKDGIDNIALPEGNMLRDTSLHRFFERHGQRSDEHPTSERSRSVVYRINDLKPVELILISSRVSSMVLSEFDINVCLCYWDGKLLYTACIEDILNHVMRTTTCRSQSIFTLPTYLEERLNKYTERGFTCTEEKMSNPEYTYQPILVLPLTKDKNTSTRLEQKFIEFQSSNPSRPRTLQLNAFFDFVSFARKCLADDTARLQRKLKIVGSLSDSARRMKSCVSHPDMENETDMRQFVDSSASQADDLHRDAQAKLCAAKEELDFIHDRLCIKNDAKVDSNDFPICGICYSKPVKCVLKCCGHTFCQECLQNQARFRCSYCQVRFHQQDIIRMYAA